MTKAGDKAKDFKKELEALCSRFFDMENFSNATAEMRKNTKATLQGFANRFDLVTREEFQAQQKTLAEAVKKLGDIEKKLDKLAPQPKAKKAAKKGGAAKKAAKPSSKKA